MSAKAKESAQVKKARKKLKQQLDTEHKRITKEALDKMTESIQRWISRHANERLPLKDKSFTLFDENQHSARTKSKFIQHLLGDLKNQMRKSESLQTLEGRITVK
jgi:hypothetical protein